ncbi:MAG: hypothetical protein VXX79_14575, partial [Pseudomonadota bacterium]|nr:hypothetical protein [Pseudomonadota bacterium]
ANLARSSSQFGCAYEPTKDVGSSLLSDIVTPPSGYPLRTYQTQMAPPTADGKPMSLHEG